VRRCRGRGALVGVILFRPPERWGGMRFPHTRRRPRTVSDLRPAVVALGHRRATRARPSRPVATARPCGPSSALPAAASMRCPPLLPRPLLRAATGAYAPHVISHMYVWRGNGLR